MVAEPITEREPEKAREHARTVSCAVFGVMMNDATEHSTLETVWKAVARSRWPLLETKERWWRSNLKRSNAASSPV